MTVTEEAKKIRSEVAQLSPGRGRKYTRNLKRRIVSWFERAVGSGMFETECSLAIGVPLRRLETWCNAAKRAAATDVPMPETPRPTSTTALLPVAIREDYPFGPGITFATPSGYRIEGLGLDQAIGLLRAFA